VQAERPTKNDLFAVHDDPIRDWASLAKDLEGFQPSLLKVWKTEYECWKHHYQRFRDFEAATLFTIDEAGNLPKPQEGVMRLHRRCVLALLQSGEICAQILLALNLEGDEAQERLELKRRIRTLLDSLQETLELWHPVNVERVEQGKAIFK
jgi:hypothetical protein